MADSKKQIGFNVVDDITLIKSKTSGKSDIICVNFESIPDPSFKIVSNKDYVMWGEDNLYPNYLVELTNKSAIHNALVVGKSNICYGDGFYIKNKDKLDETQLTNLTNWINNPNPEETLNDILKNVCNDVAIFQGFALQVIWSKDKKRIAEVYHIDILKLRPFKKDDKGRITSFYYSDDWSNEKKNPPKEIPAFNTEKRTGNQILYYKNHWPGETDYFPRESYRGGIAYINIDNKIGNFHLSNLDNGMTPTVFVTIKGAAKTDDEKKQIAKKFKDSYQGTNNAGKFILNFAEEDATVEVNTISPTDIDKQFVVLNDMVVQNIMTSHRVVSKMLFGVAQSGQLGGRAEIETASELFQNYVISPDQQAIENVFKKLMSINGLDYGELRIKRLPPVSQQFSETILKQITTINEMRSMIDLPTMNVKVADLLPTDNTNNNVGNPSAPILNPSVDVPSVDGTTPDVAPNNLRTTVGGITGILQIQDSVSQGKTDYESAITMLTELYGFDDSIARKMLGTPKEAPITTK
jgi:hypothetical protein